MSDNIKIGDFVQLEYTGHLAQDGTVFDTTDAAIAQKSGIHNPRSKYGPVTICIGEHMLIRGLDEELTGKAAGGSYSITVSPERAFGKKDAKLIQLIPTQKFRKEGIQPAPGLQINVDGMLGTIKSVSGGRTLVDFNHPLSGREVRYEVKVLKRVTDASEKLQAFVSRTLQLESVKVSTNEGKATVELPFELPEEILGEFTEKIRKAVPELKEIAFTKAAEKPAPAEHG